MFLNILKQPSISYVLRKLFPLVCELFSHFFMISLLGNEYILILWRQMYHLVHGFPSCFASGLEEMRLLVLMCSHQWTSETVTLQGVQMRTLSKDLGPEELRTGRLYWAIITACSLARMVEWLTFTFPCLGPRELLSVGRETVRMTLRWFPSHC